VRANVLRNFVATFLDRIWHSGANAITNSDTERNANAHAESIDAGATAHFANNL
jgi:hypothetical protein